MTASTMAGSRPAATRQQQRSSAPGRSSRSWWPVTLLLVLGADVGAVLALGLARLPLDLAAPGGLAIWAGRMAGLLAEVLILALVLLAARVPTLERTIGQDRLLRWHRQLAPVALAALLAHPLLLALGYGAPWWSSLVSLGSTTLDAVVGTALLLVVSISSARVARRRLPYEGWHLLHLMTYTAVILAFLHQLGAGSAVLQGTVVRTWWLAQLIGVLTAAATFRLALPLLRSARHDLRVSEVRRDSPDVVTVTVSGTGIEKLGARGGQFLVWRFLDRRHWWHAHPFSLSAQPSDHELRFTAREIGDGTRALQHLRPGTRLLVEGPYGLLTTQASHAPKTLMIGAGLGIAPMRALLEELPADSDAVVLHRASTAAEAVLHDELTSLTADRPATRLHLVAGPRGASDDPSRPLSSQHLLDLVPDITDREVYLCGPPALTAQLIRDLRQLGVPAARLHHESFEL